MRRIILLRHGEAEPRAASGRDVDRALTDHGRRDATAAGAALAAAGLSPDRALVSSALRAQQTWAAADQHAATQVETRHDLYEAAADALLRSAQSCDADTVVVVAHNPGLAELAARLAGTPLPFPPAGLVAFTWDHGDPQLVLRWEPQ